ncbi:hypothetical protein BJV78DRAFT_754859 [Lactifluus subvellereus]|nr:hypothetical protein BJV78DRAFT_754859 [Lactifluus subvellereus]
MVMLRGGWGNGSVRSPCGEVTETVRGGRQARFADPSLVRLGAHEHDDAVVHTLRSAASRGQVIINHYEWRSDILILLQDRSPSLITTTDGFYDRAIELSDRLMQTSTSALYAPSSRASINLLAGQSLRNFASWRYRNNPELGGVRRLFFIPFPLRDGSNSVR